MAMESHLLYMNRVVFASALRSKWRTFIACSTQTALEKPFFMLSLQDNMKISVNGRVTRSIHDDVCRRLCKLQPQAKICSRVRSSLHTKCWEHMHTQSKAYAHVKYYVTHGSVRTWHGKKCHTLTYMNTLLSNFPQAVKASGCKKHADDLSV